MPFRETPWVRSEEGALAFRASEDRGSCSDGGQKREMQREADGFPKQGLSLSQILSTWPEATNRAMRVHAGPAQADQVDAPRPGAIETIDRGSEFSSASSAERAAARSTDCSKMN